MKKWINLCIKTTVFFLVDLVILYIAQKLGAFKDLSIWIFASGLTIGWLATQGIGYLWKKRKSKQQESDSSFIAGQ